METANEQLKYDAQNISLSELLPLLNMNYSHVSEFGIIIFIQFTSFSTALFIQCPMNSFIPLLCFRKFYFSMNHDNKNKTQKNTNFGCLNRFKFSFLNSIIIINVFLFFINNTFRVRGIRYRKNCTISGHIPSTNLLFLLCCLLTVRSIEAYWFVIVASCQ